MGNALGSKNTAKIMKINGESFKLKTPVKAGTVVKDFPGHVLLESETVKRLGTRAKPLDPHQNLESKRIYFMVELPRTWKEGGPRRVRSGIIQMSAKERLENLKLSRRSSSDLSVMKKEYIEDRKMMRSVTLKLPKWKVEKLRKESENGSEFSNKIAALCLLNIPKSLIYQRQHLLRNGGIRSFGIEEEEEEEEEGVEAHEVINSF